MRKKAEPIVEVTLIRQSPRWRYVRFDIEDVVARALRAGGCNAGGQLAVVLMDDAAIQEINHQFRSKNKPTNVLSFPSDEPGELGDLLLAYETIAREAQAQGKTIKAHTMHMLVHGVLHLLGYDHETETQAQQMEVIEISLLSQLGIENPYQLR